MTFKAFYQMMILLFWLIMLIGGTAGATVWIRERFADRAVNHAKGVVAHCIHDPEADVSQSIPSSSSDAVSRMDRRMHEVDVDYD